MARRTNGTGTGVRTRDGVLLHTETDGPPDADLTVVFVHGFAAQLQEFDAQRHALRHIARLVLFDQRGHGRSGWRGQRSATPDDLARDLNQVLDDVAVDGPVVLVAHSMGGMAVITLAARRPELFGTKVAGAALLSTSAGHLARTAVPAPEARLLVRTGLARAALWLVWLVAPVADAVGLFRTSWGRRWLTHRLFGRGDPGPAAETMRRMWARTPQSRAASFYPGMLLYHREEALPVFRRIPTLVLAGTDDATIPAARSRRIARGIGPRVQLVLVPGAGHMVNMTHADVVNEALLALLDRVGRLQVLSE